MPTMKGLTLDIGHIQVPQHFRCPISLELMKDPVILSTGHTYDRSSIETWIASGNTTCPLTMQPLPMDFNFIPNHTLRRLIQEWCVTNRSKGVERIPTPKQPADPARVSYLLAEATSSTTPLAPIQALRILVGENERNKAVLVDQSAIPILLSLLFSNAVRENPIDLEVVEEALATLVSLPLSAHQCADGNALLPDKLLFMSSLLRHPRVTMRANVTMFLAVLSELPESHAAMAKTDGLIQALLGLIDEGISSSSSSATLVVAAIKCLYSLCLSDAGKQIATLLGAATTLVDYLISAKLADAAKLAEDSALGALELLCGTEGGCMAVADHPLAAPALLKFVLKSSERVAEHAMGALLAICHRSETARHNALHAGIVKELLLLMQSSCSSQTKARALDLLKLFRSAWFNNPSWMPADCGRADVVAF